MFPPLCKLCGVSHFYIDAVHDNPITVIGVWIVALKVIQFMEIATVEELATCLYYGFQHATDK